MTAFEMKERLREMNSHILFDYKGQSCGVDPLSIKHYDMWYGDKTTQAKSLDEVMSTKFFDGYSLNEIVGQVENVEL